MQANHSLPAPKKSHKLPKIFFRVVSLYRVIDGEKNTGKSQDFIVEAQDAKEAAVLAIAKISGPFIANLRLSVTISHTSGPVSEREQLEGRTE